MKPLWGRLRNAAEDPEFYDGDGSLYHEASEVTRELYDVLEVVRVYIPENHENALQGVDGALARARGEQ